MNQSSQCYIHIFMQLHILYVYPETNSSLAQYKEQIVNRKYINMRNSASTGVAVLLACLLIVTQLMVTNSWFDPPEEKIHRGKELIFVHIPKTAGMSFRGIINAHGGFDIPHREWCYKDLLKEYKARWTKGSTYMFPLGCVFTERIINILRFVR